ncbi:hypothetical protein QJQ45_006719 [Haematococcus lacustris]|nr:hypothetical protein QJQ45_006719 [Haematococcus lacustris]
MLLGSDNVSLFEDLSSKGLSYRLTRPGNQTAAAGGPPVDPIVIYRAGGPYRAPNALCKVVHLLEDEWELCAWKASWWPSYTPPLIAVVVVVVLVLTVAVFMVLLSRLLPKATILRMQAEIDWDADATAIDEQLGMMASGTPAEQMLVVIEDVLMGRPPALPTVMAVRSALQQSLDVYKPLQEDLSQRMANTGNLDVDRATPQLFSGAIINDSTRPSDLDGVSSSFLFQPAKVQSPTASDPKPSYPEHSTLGDLPLLAARGPKAPKLPPLPQTASLQRSLENTQQQHPGPQPMQQQHGTNGLAHLVVDGAEQGRGLDRVAPGPLTLPGARSPSGTPASSVEGSQIAVVPQGALALDATEAASALPAVPEPLPAVMELSTLGAPDLPAFAREVIEHVPCQGMLFVSWMLQQPAVERTPPCCGAELLHSLNLKRHGTSISSHASVVLHRVVPAQAAAPQPLTGSAGSGAAALAALAARSSPQRLGEEAGKEASKDSDRLGLLRRAGQRQSTEATVAPVKSTSPVAGAEQGKSVAGEHGMVSTPPLSPNASKDLKSEAALGRSNQFMMNGARMAGPMHTFQLAAASQQRLANSEGSPGKGSQLGQVPKQLEDALDSASKWAFDAFTLDAAACGHPLSILAFWVLQQSGLCSWARLDEGKLARWLCRIEEGYAANPYHNRIHAADVVGMDIE